MVRKTQLIYRGQVASRHIVHLFDSTASLAEAVSEFVSDAFAASSTLLIVARPRHWDAIADRSKRLGCPVDDALLSRRLTVLPTDQAMAGFMRNGEPVAHLFDVSVGALVARLAERSPNGLRIYGEMVDVLAAERNFPAAAQLEELWNALGQRQSFTLLCGYAAAHFSDRSTAPLLATICHQHSEVSTDGDDSLAGWVLHRTA